jgi:hypothetical protein
MGGTITSSLVGFIYQVPREIPFGHGAMFLVNGFGYPIRLFHLYTVILLKVLSGCISCLNLPMAQTSELTIMLPAVGTAIRSSVGVLKTTHTCSLCLQWNVSISSL